MIVLRNAPSPQVAVAVKTLKAGSTVDEKIDFLSEAEMMKRFTIVDIILKIMSSSSFSGLSSTNASKMASKLSGMN